MAREAVAELGVSAVVEKVSDIQAMMVMGVLSSPAVAIDGQLRCQGRVPSRDDIMRWIREGSGDHGAHCTSPGCRCGGGD